MKDLGTVMLGLKTAVAPAVLHELAEFDVVVLICDWRGVPVAGTYKWSEHTRVGARHLAQFSMSVPRRKNAWGQIIRAKIAGQAANLRVTGHKDWQKLDAMVKLVRSGDPDNVEARAARFYWSRLFEADKFSRVPQAGIGRNALLDYGYAVLRGFGVRAVVGAGLNATLGVFHKGRANGFNLVDDVIEPFRPAVDWVVANMSPDVSPNHPAVKAALVAASSQQFYNGGPDVAACISDLAQLLGMYSEGAVDKLAVPGPWTGPTVKTPIEALV
jgi:CRISPR-associated protein Cas1